MRISLVLLTAVFLVSCSKKVELDTDFHDLIGHSKYSVLMFFAPDCPLCITFSKPFKELSKEYKDMQFIAVQSGEHYDAMEIQMYATDVKLNLPIYRDYDYEVARFYNATVTPQFYVVDSSGNVLYSGLLDDRMKTLGVYKQHWKEFYLKDALKAISNGESPKINETEPIGCVLEY